MHAQKLKTLLMLEAETLFSLVLLLMTSLPQASGWLGAHHAEDLGAIAFISDRDTGTYAANLTGNELITELKYTKMQLGRANLDLEIVYDPRHRYLFRSCSLRRSRTMMINTGLNFVDETEVRLDRRRFYIEKIASFDLDEVFHTIYWIEDMSPRFAIHKANITDLGNVKNHATLFQVYRRLYGLKYDILYRRIFWTDGEKIWAAYIDRGLIKNEFVNVGTSAGLRDTYIDHGESRIYWFTRGGKVESMNLDGTDRRVHYSNPWKFFSPYVIHKFGDMLYWTDQMRIGIGVINLISGEEVAFTGELLGNGQETFDLSNKLYGLTIGRTVEVNYCSKVTCLGGGTCTNQALGALCICTSNWKGTRCELDVDECLLETHPCDFTHGTCHNTYGSYECGCEGRYYLSGETQCLESLNCGDACLSGGTCMIDGCVCKPGFFGYNCEKVDCDINPCRVGSICSGNTCLCQPGFKGDTCESVDCSIDPCVNGGLCENDSCSCPREYTGTTCWFKLPFTLSYESLGRFI